MSEQNNGMNTQNEQQNQQAAATAENKKFCRYCGALIDADSVVCPKCGKQVEMLRQEVAQQPQIFINNTNTNTNTSHSGVGFNYPQKSKIVALILCIFLGFFGIHRFYVGKVGTGLLWMFTGSLCGIGWIMDLILILVGSFRDKAGMPLK